MAAATAAAAAAAAAAADAAAAFSQNAIVMLANSDIDAASNYVIDAQHCAHQASEAAYNANAAMASYHQSNTFNLTILNHVKDAISAAEVAYISVKEAVVVVAAAAAADAAADPAADGGDDAATVADGGDDAAPVANGGDDAAPVPVYAPLRL